MTYDVTPIVSIGAFFRVTGLLSAFGKWSKTFHKCVGGGGESRRGGIFPPLLRGGYISGRQYCRNDFIFNAL